MLTKKMCTPCSQTRSFLWMVVSGLTLSLVAVHALNEPIPPSINLEIGDGQGGALLPKEEEEEPGAFTVANKNDTDGDGTADLGDNDISGELDLMELKLNPPVPNTNPEEVITLTLGGNARLYKSSDKKSGQQTELSWKAKDLPKTYWVELQDASSSVRGETFTLTGAGATDSVKATGIWVDYSDFRNKKAQPLWTDCDPPAKDLFTIKFNQFGGVLNAQGVSNACGFEFLSKPSGLSSENKVKFDVTRQLEFRGYYKDDNNPNNWTASTALDRNWPAIDAPNDESPNNTDNDNVPDHGDHIYSLDAPGFDKNDGVLVAFQKRTNFREFVRVNVGKNATTPNQDKPGSRCSDKVKWYEFLLLLRDTSKTPLEYKLDPNMVPKVDLGHIDITNNSGGNTPQP